MASSSSKGGDGVGLWYSRRAWQVGEVLRRLVRAQHSFAVSKKFCPSCAAAHPVCASAGLPLLLPLAASFAL